MTFDLAWLRRRRVESDLEAEFAEHLRARAADLERAGLAPAEARRRARLEFGSLDNYQEQARAAAGVLSLETLWQDLRFGLRLLRKSPGFTLTAVLMLALGIGANAALFSMVDWLLLRPLPGVAQPGGLTYLVAAFQSGGNSNGFSFPNYTDIRLQSTAAFSGVAEFLPFQQAGIAVQGVARSTWVDYVSGNYFDVLGLRAAAGRLFEPGEGENPASPGEVVLSDSYWRSRFGGRDVIGQSIAVDGHPARIVGVAPPGFHGAIAVLEPQAFLTLNLNRGGEQDLSGDFLHDRAHPAGFIIARRRAGVSLARVQPVLQVIARRLARQYPKDDPWRGLRAVPLTAEPPGAAANAVDPLHLAAALFLALAGLVLLLACVNIANLLLARAAARRREMAVRAALGAGRRRLLRQLLVESLLLGALGGAGGLGVALAACRLLNSLPLHSAVPIALAFGLSWRVFAYTAAIALGAGLAVGLTPAWQASRLPPATVLQGASRTSLGARTRLRSTLVVAEIAGSLMLLITAGLFTRSLIAVQHTDLGFQPAGVVNLSLDPHEIGYSQARALDFDAALLARVRALPGVASASLAATVPLGVINYSDNLVIPGYRPAPGELAGAGYNAVTPDFFQTLGIRLLRGRGFRPSDGPQAPRVAVINQTMARRYWPGSDVIGRSFTLQSDPTHPIQIVGLARDSHTDDLTGGFAPYMYLPLAQVYRSPITLQIRSAGAGLENLARAARGQIAALDPGMPVTDVQTMMEGLHSLNGLFIFQLGAGLAAAMGLIGLLLAVIGVYGVIAYSASQRTQEIGVRLALGARRGQVLRLIMIQGLRLTLFGVALGLVLAALLSGALAGMLAGIGRFDLPAYAGATLLLAAVALLASLIPALRALRTEPAAALRCE